MFDLRLKLDHIVLDKENQTKILENLRYCRRIVGKQFKVIFWNQNLQESDIKTFLSESSNLLFEVNTTITIFDIKTSTRGWNKWMKADKNKTQQLLLYKQFYSKQYDHPIDKIEVEYFIVKRKLWENLDFPQKRVQKFSPASGTVSMNKVGKRLDTFLNEAFTDTGEKKNNMIPTPSK